MKKGLNKIIAKAPNAPGIYKFLDEDKKVLYVGKAKDLRKRLQSYVRPSAKHGTKTEKMLESAESVEWVETNSEVEALILEDNTVKTLQPKYNVLLKDDKNFQYIKVTIDKDYPEVYTVRRIEKDGAKYFGPKTNGTDVQRLMESVKKIFKLCSQKNITVDKKGTPLKGAKVAVKVGGTKAKRPCLDYHIKRCTGPCAGVVSPEEYREQIDQALQFLSGDFKPAIEAIKKQMRQFADEKKFERAASLRDHIMAIEKSAHRQLITDTNLPDRDVIAYVEDLGKNYFVLFQIRGGKLIGQERFISEGGESPAEVMEAFLTDYYSRAADIPKEVIISIEVKEVKVLQDYISSQTDHKVKLVHPRAGQKDQLIELAEKNARSYAQQSRVRWMAEKKGEQALPDLQKALKLQELPKRIECYDISHLSGTETVGSMVVFKKGESAKADYRQLRLRSTIGKIDDYKSIEEVINRRLNYLEEKLPDGYKINKAKKKDFDSMIKIAEKINFHHRDWDYKHFYLLEKDKKIVGFCRSYDLSDKVHRIGALWVDEKEKGKKLGYHLLAKVIVRSKAKRLYLMCHPELEEYYLKFGFELLREPPKELKDLHKKFEKNSGKKIDIVYFAYQKKKKDTSFTSTPDLIVIDGGKGQLQSAHQVLFDRGLNIPIIALAKKEEEVFIPGKSDPINLPKDSEASYLLQRIRDEAHRFAIEHNRSSRDKKMVKSGLDAIPGVGPKMKKKLLMYFGSVHKIKEAPQVVLEQVVGEEVARRIKEKLI
ncbi:excinuclease ABC subunit UvrC [Patescibacteria group bacterium]|nr:excinuclease ABC subunit UvrC [Patescibacteria group bacterium]MBU1683666.1 excinuclease ABC subunit UvrC [Patescibacteria group bacterium]MBU1935636.1 excinuclease ABC subunit UvrC [Patescibacteria group bacterium]